MKTDTLFKTGGCAGSFPAPTETRAVFDPTQPDSIRHESFCREYFGSRTTSFFLRHRNTFVIVDHGLGVEPIAAFIRDMLQHEDAKHTVVHCIQTHYHEDHLSGLRANALLFNKNVTLRFYSPDLTPFLKQPVEASPEPAMQEVVRTTFRECYWPVTLERLLDEGASHEHVCFKPGDTLQMGELRVHTLPLSHPGGCCGLRFELPGDRDIVIATDYEPASSPTPAVVDFFKGCGLLVADMQYRDCEFEGEAGADGIAFPRAGWGHGSPSLTLPTILACQKRPQRVWISHHDPKRTDDALRRYYAETLTQLEGWNWGNAFDYKFVRDGEFLWL